MSVLGVISDVLLALGVLLTVVCAVGVMVMRDPYQRLHFVSPPATLSAALVAGAVILHGGNLEAIVKVLLVCLLLTFQNGLVSHATARAAFVRAEHCWPPPEGEIEPAEPDPS